MFNLEAMKDAFTLIELMVVIAIVAVLAGISIPGYERVVQSGRTTACLSNLRQIGVGLNAYLQDHDSTMPVLKAGRHDKSEDVPVIDNTLDSYVKDPAVFACPADMMHIATASGTSYYWNVALNGQSLASLNFLHITSDQGQIPLIADKEGFHPYTAKKVNILYADGHVAKDLRFSTGP